MGSTDFYPEEEPVREVEVDGFSIDRTPVTVAQYERFVAETGYLTVAERPLDAADYPDVDPALLVEGSIVFHPTGGPVQLNDPRQWWSYVPGASWRHPWGPASDSSERQDHPVTQVAFEDAEAYANWAGRSYRPRPSGSTQRVARSTAQFCLGRSAGAERRTDGELLAGRLPVAEHGRQGLARHDAGWPLPAQRLRASRCHRQRLGVDERLLRRARRQR